jgi:hypothetical protein
MFTDTFWKSEVSAQMIKKLLLSPPGSIRVIRRSSG